MKQITTILILLYCLASNAQQQMTVSGKIIDAADNKPLRVSTVTTDDGQTATVSNDDGIFRINVSSDTKNLIISRIGYKRRTVAINKRHDIGIIRLQSEAVNLGEIVVSTPIDIINEAILKITDNYPVNPTLSDFFYRETTQKGNRYIYVAEAVGKMIKTSYKRSAATDRIFLTKGRRIINMKEADTLGAKIQGGPNMAIVADFVKNQDFILSKELLEGYEFQMEYPEMVDGRLLTVISFIPKAQYENSFFNGKFYIDSETMAFIKADFNLDMNDKARATEYMLKKKPLGVRFKPKEMNTQVYFITIDGKTYLHYISNRFVFKCDWKRKLFSQSFVAESELVVTERKDDGKIIPPPVEVFRRDASLYDQIQLFRDHEFWNDYNVIPLTEKLINVVDKLYKKNKQR